MGQSFGWSVEESASPTKRTPGPRRVSVTAETLHRFGTNGSNRYNPPPLPTPVALYLCLAEKELLRCPASPRFKRISRPASLTG